MKFLSPAFLFALFAVLIPVLIHLFSFRRYKTVYFSNVDFLKDIKRESQKKSKLKQILILIARILTIVFMVFAFSQPFLPADNGNRNQPNQIVAIYVDNSFSMNALSEKGQLLEVAKNKALEICMAYPAGTKFMLFTNDLFPKHQNIFNREQFIQQVSEIEISPNLIPLSLLHDRFSANQGILEESAGKTIYFVSDFQRSVTDLENFENNDVFNYLLPLKPNQLANLYIDSVWVEVPAHRLGQEEKLFVRIKNSSNQEFQNLPLKLILNDSVKSITSFSVQPGDQITANLKYTNTTSGVQNGKIEISDYPFTHDNNWFISYFVEPTLKALAVYDQTKSSQEGAKYLSALFAGDEYIQLDETNIQNIQISKLTDYNTIFLLNPAGLSSGLINELAASVEKGSSLVLFPGRNTNQESANTLLARLEAGRITGTDTTKLAISGLDFDNTLFKDVFRKKEENPVLPEISSHFQFEKNARTAETTLLWFQNNDKALSVLARESGKFWVFSFPLDKTSESFVRNTIFVPTLYNIVLNSLPAQAMSMVIGKNTFIDIPANKNIDLSGTIEVEKLKSAEKFIPEKNVSLRGTRIDFGNQITTDGHYRINNNGNVVSVAGFNYNRGESELSYFNLSELEEKAEQLQLKNTSVVDNAEAGFAEIFEELQNGKQLWKWCILLAFLFILAEVLISRFWK